MKFKAIILDMDGTMLDEKSSISVQLADYIRLLRQMGIFIFIATGRSMREIKDVIPKDLEVDGIVTANGMAGYIKEEQYFQYKLSTELVKNLVQLSRKNEIYYEIHPCIGRRMAFSEDRNYFMEHIQDPIPSSMEENEWLSRKSAIKEEIDWKDHIELECITKIYYFSREIEKIQEWKKILDQMKEKENFSTFSSSLHNVEIMAPNVSKATGVTYLLDKFNISKEHILAVGDGENDIPLFNLASHSVAMKNANDKVKKHVDEVTMYSYKEDGLFHFLKENFKI